MLVISRKRDERIMIDGGRIVITIVQTNGYQVRVGIEAPVDVVIDREELHLKRIKGSETK